MKTVLLEVRPFFLRKKGRTCGHVFAAMLALKVAREIHARLKNVYGTTDDDEMAVTLDDALTALGRLCFNVYEVNGRPVERLPRPDERQKKILGALGIRWPTAGSSNAPQRAVATLGGGP